MRNIGNARSLILKPVLAIFLINLIFSSAFSQNISPAPFDFGKVKMWNNPRATFTFTNTSGKRILFLPVQYQRNLYINLPEGYIQPGQTVQIEAVYYTEDKGNFSVSQPIYISGSDEPVYLEIRGKILSFHPDAKMACPTIEHQKNPLAKEAIATITVYDKSTGQAMNGVDILLVGASSNYFAERTKKVNFPLRGVPIGLYQLDISKPGYRPVQQIQYINSNTGDLVFELEPVKSDETPIMDQPDASGNDEIIEIEKPQDNDMDAIERIRKMMDERFKDRRIIERDVMVVKDGADTSPVPVDTLPIAQTTDVPKKDFDDSGLLNSDKYSSNNLVFLIDVSGSMKIEDKLEVMKTSMISLVNILRKQDMVTIVIYSTKARVVLTATPGDQKDKIIAVINDLRANGSSYGSEGLTMAYEIARTHFIRNGNNQVILASDGLFNSPGVTHNDIYAMANSQAQTGVVTSVVGFGNKQEAKEFMQHLAADGRGNFIQILDQQAAQSALVAEIMHNALRR